MKPNAQQTISEVDLSVEKTVPEPLTPRAQILSDARKTAKTSQHNLQQVKAGIEKDIKGFQKTLRQSLVKTLRKQNRKSLWLDALLLRWIPKIIGIKSLQVPMQIIRGLLLTCTVFAIGFCAYHLLWLPALPFAGLLLLSYSSAKAALKIEFLRALKHEAGNLKDLRFWHFQEHAPEQKYPYIGVETPPLYEKEWEAFRSYNWNLNSPPNFNQQPILLEIYHENEAAILVPLPPKGTKLVEPIVMLSLSKLQAFLPILAESITQAAKSLPSNFAKDLGSTIEQVQEVAIKKQIVDHHEQAVEFSKNNEAEWNRIYCDPDLKEGLKQRVDLFTLDPEARLSPLLASGPAGSGKTLLAEILIETNPFHSIVALPEQFLSHRDGPIACATIMFKEIDETESRVLLIIEDIERLFPQSSREAHQESFLHAFLKLWDIYAKNGKIWIVATTRDRTAIHREILNRIPGEIKLGKLDSEGVKFVLEQAFKDLHCSISINDELIQCVSSLPPRSIQSVATKAVESARPHPPKLEHFKKAASQYAQMMGTEVDQNATWDRLVLPSETLQKLQTTLQIIRNAKEYEKQGIKAPRGMLLYGPPGTGKTQIARTLANEAALGFKAVTTSDLKGPYLGWGAKQTKEVFAAARSMAPCILFIDEIESCAKRRDSGDSDQIAQEVVTQILAEMDGAAKSEAHVFVVAATNLLDQIDSAVLSRFTEKIEIPLPGTAEIARLLQIFLSKSPLEFSLEDHLSKLASQFDGSSGRDLQNIVAKAQRRALERAQGETISISIEDLQQALDQRTITDEDIDRIWNKIVLPPEIDQSLRRNIRLFNSNSPAAPRGLLLYGPPGTGKSLIATRIADSCNCDFISLNTADLKGPYLGQGAQRTKKIWEKARLNGKAIIFLDECDALFSDRNNSNSDAIKEEVINTFLAEWDGLGSRGQIWVIGATNRKDSLDTAIIQRFGNTLEIPNPDGIARCQILKLELAKANIDVPIPDFVATETTGLSGRMLSQLSSSIIALADGQSVEIKHFEEAIKSIRKAQSTQTSSNATWDRLIISDKTLKQLNDVGTILRNVDYFKSQKIDIPTGILLWGPPGTGKTQIARTLANESRVAFLTASTADLKGSHVGESTKKTSQIFNKAREIAPCILFIDEIESVVPSRGAGDSYTQEIVTQLLQEMDGVKEDSNPVFVVAATNLPDSIDSAIISRFAEKIEVPMPTVEQRVKMLKVFIGNLQTEFELDNWINETAILSEGLSGRDLNNAVKKAAKAAAIREVIKDSKNPPVIKAEDFTLPHLS